MELNNSEKKQLEEHLKAIAKILYQNTPAEKLTTFEELEINLRENIQQEITPALAEFFFQKSVKQKPEE